MNSSVANLPISLPGVPVSNPALPALENVEPENEYYFAFTVKNHPLSNMGVCKKKHALYISKFKLCVFVLFFNILDFNFCTKKQQVDMASVN